VGIPTGLNWTEAALLAFDFSLCRRHDLEWTGFGRGHGNGQDYLTDG
jgi:hypothetical protein